MTVRRLTGSWRNRASSKAVRDKGAARVGGPAKACGHGVCDPSFHDAHALRARRRRGGPDRDGEFSRAMWSRSMPGYAPTVDTLGSNRRLPGRADELCAELDRPAPCGERAETAEEDH
ncbi:hypothetical protein GCM10022205_60960 [Spinactinospora alkalitolerans]